MIMTISPKNPQITNGQYLLVLVVDLVVRTLQVRYSTEQKHRPKVEPMEQHRKNMKVTKVTMV